MLSAARLRTAGLLLCLVVSATGCDTSRKSWRRVKHEFQPHRMNRLNQWDGPSLDTGQFSVQDHISDRDTLPAPSEEGERGRVGEGERREYPSAGWSTRLPAAE